MRLYSEDLFLSPFLSAVFLSSSFTAYSDLLENCMSMKIILNNAIIFICKYAKM